jgi:hypothetical protein
MPTLLQSLIFLLASREAATEDVSEISARPISVIQLSKLDSIHDLIQLVHILTPTGWDWGRKQLMSEIGTSHSGCAERRGSESDPVLSVAAFS